MCRVAVYATSDVLMDISLLAVLRVHVLALFNKHASGGVYAKVRFTSTGKSSIYVFCAGKNKYFILDSCVPPSCEYMHRTSRT